MTKEAEGTQAAMDAAKKVQAMAKDSGVMRRVSGPGQHRVAEMFKKVTGLFVTIAK